MFENSLWWPLAFISCIKKSKTSVILMWVVEHQGNVVYLLFCITIIDLDILPKKLSVCKNDTKHETNCKSNDESNDET